MISLSPKAIEMLPQLQKIWDSCEKAILKLLAEDLSILSYLNTIDQELKDDLSIIASKGIPKINTIMKKLLFYRIIFFCPYDFCYRD